MMSKWKHSGRQGSALLIVLGMFAFMLVSAVSFSIYMRASRAPSSYVRRNASARHLVKAALARAIDEIDMALGNAIGSNVFNILLVLGIASSISPIGFMMSNAVAIAAVIVATVVCWAVAAKNKSLGKVMGAIMVLSYFGYMVYVVMRETGAL